MYILHKCICNIKICISIAKKKKKKRKKNFGNYLIWATELRKASVLEKARVRRGSENRRIG